MEQHLLRVLAFDMTAPTVLQFLMQYTLEEQICARTTNLALVSLELWFALLDFLAELDIDFSVPLPYSIFQS